MYHKFLHLRTKYFIGENIFTYLSKKKAPAGKCTHGKFFKIIFFRERNFLVSQNFTSDNYIFHRENSYFSYTIFFSHHKRIYSHHSRVFSHHNRVLSKHNRVLSKHNRVLLKHNRILLNHNRVLSKHKKAKIRGKWSDSS